MTTKDVEEFGGWFGRSYMGLKERLPIYGEIDEDTFHDAYLTVRKQITFSGVGIEDPEPYFFGCYGGILQPGTRDKSRYDSSGDKCFVRLGETDCAEETEKREEMLAGYSKLARDIQKFPGWHSSYEDYRILMLWLYEIGSSFRIIARHMSEKTSVMTCRVQAVMESVRTNRKFIAGRGLIMVGETA